MSKHKAAVTQVHQQWNYLSCVLGQINIGSGNNLSPGTKPWPEPMMTWVLWTNLCEIWIKKQKRIIAVMKIKCIVKCVQNVVHLLWSQCVNTCFGFSLVMYLCVIFTDIPEDAVNEDSDDEEKANPDERISSMLLTLYVLNFSEGTWTYIYILCHSSTLIRHR